MPVDAKAPTEVVADLPTADTRDIYTRVAQLPPSLRRALTKTFHQRELFIADAGQPVQETDVIIATRGYKPLPTRRLEFAFRTRSFWIVTTVHGATSMPALLLYFLIREHDLSGGASSSRHHVHRGSWSVGLSMISSWTITLSYGEET